MKRGLVHSGIVSLVLTIFTFSGLVMPTEANAGSYASMSCYELWYARNAIYADKGYCFSTRKAIDTFGRRCYAPYGRLNQWEKNQVSEIKYWERQNGCSGNYTPRRHNNVSGYAKVVGIRWNDSLAVRSGPSTGYPRIGNLPPNATGIEILNCTRSWCRIRYGNLVGWSYAQYLRSY